MVLKFERAQAPPGELIDKVDSQVPPPPPNFRLFNLRQRPGNRHFTIASALDANPEPSLKYASGAGHPAIQLQLPL